ncbi:C1 family peptidase [Terriglobus sp. ADX1]
MTSSLRNAKKQTDELPKAARPARKKNVVPDSIDLRDRTYMPTVRAAPLEVLAPEVDVPVLDQEQSNACTGFALASVIYHLQFRSKREREVTPVSPFMLYSMARRYDEFPGDPNADTGSSLRGAMKGWFKHGACAATLWPSFVMPDPQKNPTEDWWQDSAKRPLGAYYRIDNQSITDMQSALNEVGAIYASAACHQGWETWKKGAKVSKEGYWTIPYQKATAADGGHAFAILGYTKDGFIIQNSWDVSWATKGRAILTYQDWLDNAMDCWVGQLGVVSSLHLEIAAAPSLRTNASGAVTLAVDNTLRDREIDPFIVDMENNGLLSNTGEFRTQQSDLTALLTNHLNEARSKWGLSIGDVVDIAIYAHGGLTSEDDAADTAARWIPALYDAKIFPIFLMWETDLWSTLKDRVADLLATQQRITGGFWDKTKAWWDERLEKMLTVPGTAVWGEMKQNADAISAGQGGGVLLYDAWQEVGLDPAKVRLHLIGHSAGAIVHSWIVKRLNWNFATVNLMAPACRRDLFEQCVIPALQESRVKQFNEFHMSDDVEQKDNTCKPILGYSRSLLYLVSQSFEKGTITPILGMEKYFSGTAGIADLKNVKVFTSPGPDTRSTTHGGFDNDPSTMTTIIGCIKSTG